jgi:transcriptional regulator with XRE-family HTH domain
MLSVKHYLDRNGLSCEQFGAKIGVHRSHISKMINGDRAPSVQILRKIHELTSIPYKTLIHECT